MLICTNTDYLHHMIKALFLFFYFLVNHKLQVYNHYLFVNNFVKWRYESRTFFLKIDHYTLILMQYSPSKIWALISIGHSGRKSFDTKPDCFHFILRSAPLWSAPSGAVLNIRADNFIFFEMARLEYARKKLYLKVCDRTDTITRKYFCVRV